MLYRADLYLNDGTDPVTDGTIYPAHTILVFAENEEQVMDKAEAYWRVLIDLTNEQAFADPDPMRDTVGMGVVRVVPEAAMILL